MKRCDESGATATKLHGNKIARMGKCGNGCRLQLSPHILKIVKPLLASQPFRRAHCAIGEALARLGIVAEVDAVGGAFEHDLVHAHDLALAKRK